MKLKGLLLLLTMVLLSCSKKIVVDKNDSADTRSTFEKATDEIKEFRKELNEDYKGMDNTKSPLSLEQKDKFKKSGGHKFYPINLGLRINADLDTTIESKNINFETTTERIAVYDVYGVATFKVDGKEQKVNIYQSHYLRDKEEYKDHLFLPFNDLTNGGDTYGGGRYIDLKTTDITNNTLTIDFNKAYNPYCAYGDGWNCPIPPPENNLQIAITAGEKMYLGSKKERIQ